MDERARVRFGQGFSGAGGINIDDLFGDIFSGGGGFGPIPGADQEAILNLTIEEVFRGGRRQISLDGRDYTVNIPAGASTGSGSAWPVRVDGATEMDLPVICTWWCGSHRIPTSGSMVVTLLPICPSRRGKRRSEQPWQLPLPEAKPRSRFPPARRPASGCGCGGKECPTPAVSPATCTRRSKLRCRRNPLHENVSCSNSWPPSRRSTRGGDGDRTRPL